jgi:prepilin-type N-terminal cleavage/methylation domain-containing protein
MSPKRRRPGFTLIELLIVVVVIGILAAIGIMRFKETKGKTYAAALRSDLKNLASLQESYFYSNDTYATSLGAVNFSSTEGVVITIAEASTGGWSATATHPAAWPLTCAVYYGGASPVTPAIDEGLINCQ